MKRRLTLAIGCLACALPGGAANLTPQTARTVQVASSSSQPSHQLHKSPLSLADAAQLAQRELDARQLTPDHSVVSVIFLKTAEPATGHYDVRIHPPARLADATWLRGFTVAADGSLSPCTTFRTSAEIAEIAQTLSTPPKSDSPHDWGLGSDPRQG